MLTHVHVYRVMALKEYDIEIEDTKDGHEAALMGLLEEADESYDTDPAWTADPGTRFIAIIPSPGFESDTEEDGVH